jgi:hypothetical protein
MPLTDEKVAHLEKSTTCSFLHRIEGTQDEMTQIMKRSSCRASTDDRFSS